jgi:hypothetical protein
MSLNLSVIDNQDGTGATATITGSAPSAANQVWIQTVSGDLGAADWILGGSRTGDGAVGLELEIGYYWAHCASQLGPASTTSNLVYFRVSRGSDPVLYRCLLATRARIQGLALPGITGTHVVIQKVASDRDLGAGQAQEFPAILISPVGGEQIPAVDSTNLRDEVVYPVLVTILAADNQNQIANFPLYLQLREAIARAFRNQALPGVDEVYQCEVISRDIVSAEAFFRHNLFLSALVLQFRAREPRGFAT